MTRGLTRARGLAAAVMVAAGAAHADSPRMTPAAIEVDRDTAPAGRIGFGFDGGEPVDAWGVSLATSWIDQPIRIGAGGFGPGAPASDPVRRRETVTLGAALALGDSAVLDAAVRGSHQVGDRLAADGDPAQLAHLVFQDLRIGGRIRVAGDRDRAALLRADVTVPTGDEAQLAGDARWTAAWSLIGRATVAGDVVIAASAGIRLHGAEVAVGDHLIGDELFAAAGVAIPVVPAGASGPLGALALTGELLGALGDHVGMLAAPSPLEARIGAIVRPRAGLAIGVHAGAGLDDQIGAPRARLVIELAWTPPASPATPAGPRPPSSGADDDDADDPP
ncbi:MAG TPA: hypothetical protein VH165_32340 [Kofleriaceae bacterium]|jgi:hypothetical protein|nr:hypothetical protein [Kofleriaceae bacterium]